MVVLATLALLLAPPSSARTRADTANPAVTIASISPGRALRGGVVTLTGNGFGAENVRITVGGTAARVLAATGNTVRFVVPANASLGPTVVRATNPGGRFGEIGLTVLFDGVVKPVEAPTGAATATIGPAGGSVSAGGVSLHVPAGALNAPHSITITPLAALDGAPLGDTFGAVQLEPSGLHFLLPATLTIPVPAGVDSRSVVGFGYDGDGTSFHLSPWTVANGTLTLHISHFSGAGAGTLTPAQSASVLGYLPTPADELAEQQISAALLAFEQAGTDPGPAIDAALNQWYVDVRVGLQSVGTSVEFFELAAGEWMAWLGFVREYERDAQHAAQNAEATGLATADGAALAGLALAACDGSGPDPYAPLKPVNRIASDLFALPVSIETQKTADGRQLPAADDLDPSCVHVHMDPPDHPAAFAFALAKNTLTADVRVVFWNGTRSDLSVEVALWDITNGQPAGSDAADVTTTGHVSMTFRPSGVKGHRSYLVTADATGLPGASSTASLGALDDSATFGADVRDRIELHDSSTLAPGDSVTVKALLAGDGMAGATVAFSVNGAGSVDVASARTDASGSASTTYTASSDPAGGTDFVVGSFDDGQGSVTAQVQMTIEAGSCAPAPRLRRLASAGSSCALSVDAYRASMFGATFAECFGHTGDDEKFFSDSPPAVTGSGPFSAALQTAPTPAAVACAAGTGRDTTSGSFSGRGSTAAGALTISASSQGTTTAVSAFTGDPFQDSCLDVGDGVGSALVVDFTTTADATFTLAGTTSFTSRGHAGYSLTRFKPSFATVLSVTDAPPSVSVSIPLPAGSYELSISGRASNDLACQETATATDSFAFGLTATIEP